MPSANSTTIRKIRKHQDSNSTKKAENEKDKTLRQIFKINLDDDIGVSHESFGMKQSEPPAIQRSRQSGITIPEALGDQTFDEPPSGVTSPQVTPKDLSIHRYVSVISNLEKSD